MKESHLNPDFNGRVLFQNSKYSIELADRRHGNMKGKQLVIIKDESYTDFLIVYEPGRVGYVNPWEFPNYIKDKVLKYSIKYYDQIEVTQTVNLK